MGVRILLCICIVLTHSKMYFLLFSIVFGYVVGEPVSVCRPTNERYFIADSVQCDRFHMCDEDGNLAAEFLCQDGLVYEPISKQCGLPFKIDDQTGDCEHPDVADRQGCTAEELYGFACPSTVGQGRYAADSDCRAFFTCAIYTNYHPRLAGCPQGSVFSPASQQCTEPKEVPGCENYYEE